MLAAPVAEGASLTKATATKQLTKSVRSLPANTIRVRCASKAKRGSIKCSVRYIRVRDDATCADRSVFVKRSRSRSRKLVATGFKPRCTPVRKIATLPQPVVPDPAPLAPAPPVTPAPTPTTPTPARTTPPPAGPGTPPPTPPAPPVGGPPGPPPPRPAGTARTSQAQARYVFRGCTDWVLGTWYGTGVPYHYWSYECRWAWLPDDFIQRAVYYWDGTQAVFWYTDFPFAPAGFAP